MAAATGESLNATARVMYRGCSICCALATIAMVFAVVQYSSARYAYPLTLETALVLMFLVVGGPALMSIAFYYLSRKKRSPADDIDLEGNSTEFASEK